MRSQRTERLFALALMLAAVAVSGCSGGNAAAADAGAGGSHTGGAGGAGGGQGGGGGAGSGDAGVTSDGAPADMRQAPPIAEADFVPTLQRIFCEELAPCCTRGGRAFDAASCRVLVASNVRRLQPAEAPFDPELGGACVERARALASPSSCLLDPADETALWGACADAYGGGTLAPGASCSSGAQCRGDRRGATDCNGSCYLDIVVGVGEACERNNGLSSIRYVCTSPSEPLECDGDAKVCRPLAGNGQSCRAQSCDAATLCDRATLTCVPRLPAGSACISDRDCDPATSCTDSRCVPRPGAGAPCSAGAPCADGLTCFTAGGTSNCRPRQALGGPCSSNDGCESSALTCMNGRCNALALPSTCIEPFAP